MNDQSCQKEYHEVRMMGAELIAEIQKYLYFIVAGSEKDFVFKTPEFEQDRRQAKEAFDLTQKKYDQAVQAYLICLEENK